MDDIFKFYGADWIGMFATFISLWMVGNKKWYGFAFGALAALCWTIFSVLAGTWAGFIANFLFIFLNLRNLWKWRVEEILPKK